MGLINAEEMQLRSGLSLANCYLSFSPAPTVMGRPVIINKGADGKYSATAVMYVYPSEDAKSQPNIPLEEHSIQVELDAGPVFDALYAELKKKYTGAQDAVRQHTKKEAEAQATTTETQESQSTKAAAEPTDDSVEANQAEDPTSDSPSEAKPAAAEPEAESESA